MWHGTLVARIGCSNNDVGPASLPGRAQVAAATSDVREGTGFGVLAWRLVAFKPTRPGKTKSYIVFRGRRQRSMVARFRGARGSSQYKANNRRAWEGHRERDVASVLARPT